MLSLTTGLSDSLQTVTILVFLWILGLLSLNVQIVAFSASSVHLDAYRFVVMSGKVLLLSRAGRLNL